MWPVCVAMGPSLIIYSAKAAFARFIVHSVGRSSVGTSRVSYCGIRIIPSLAGCLTLPNQQAKDRESHSSKELASTSSVFTSYYCNHRTTYVRAEVTIY